MLGCTACSIRQCFSAGEFLGYTTRSGLGLFSFGGRPAIAISYTRMAAPVVQWQPMPEFKNSREMHEFLDKATAGGITIRNFFGVILDVDDVVVETPLFPKAALEFYTAFNLCRTDEKRDADAYAKYYTAARGGGQGDYRPLINEKIDNVVDCLTKFPSSKRAVSVNWATLDLPRSNPVSARAGLDYRPFSPRPLCRPGCQVPARAALLPRAPRRCGRPCRASLHWVHACTGCVRTGGRGNDVARCYPNLCRRVIFPKNVHFIGTIMHEGKWYPSERRAARALCLCTLATAVARRLGIPTGTYTHFVTTMFGTRQG